MSLATETVVNRQFATDMGWTVEKPAVLLPCSLCGHEVGFIAVDGGIAVREADGKPHICKLKSEQYEGWYGPVGGLVEKYMQTYKNAAIVDLRLEYIGLQAEYERLFWEVETGGEEIQLMAWDLEGKLKAIDEEINRQVNLRKLQHRGVDFTPWRDRVSAAMQVSVSKACDLMGVDVNRQGKFCCVSPSHSGGDKNPSAQIYDDNRYTCFVCGSHGRVIDLVMGGMGLNFREAVIWLEQRAQTF